MPLEVITVPCLADNYAFLLRDNASGQTALVDAIISTGCQSWLPNTGPK